jgi:hypothetical protein
MHPARRPRPTLAPRCCCTVQALEDNQVLVQGMMANRYMATFKDPILGWNKKLMAVADVNQIMAEIQRTWSYLVSLFIDSEEVKKELPEPAARFAVIDQEIKKVGSCANRVPAPAWAQSLPSDLRPVNVPTCCIILVADR